MEKRAVIEEGRTPAESPRAHLGTLADYQEKFGAVAGQTIYESDCRSLAQLDENHPIRRAIAQTEANLTKRD